MNNIQLVCAGNCLTKPLMCWSLMDWLMIIPVVGILLILVLGRLNK